MINRQKWLEALSTNGTDIIEQTVKLDSQHMHQSDCFAHGLKPEQVQWLEKMGFAHVDNPADLLGLFDDLNDNQRQRLKRPIGLSQLLAWRMGVPSGMLLANNQAYAHPWENVYPYRPDVKATLTYLHAVWQSGQNTEEAFQRIVGAQSQEIALCHMLQCDLKTLVNDLFANNERCLTPAAMHNLLMRYQQNTNESLNSQLLMAYAKQCQRYSVINSEPELKQDRDKSAWSSYNPQTDVAQIIIACQLQEKMLKRLNKNEETFNHLRLTQLSREAKDFLTKQLKPGQSLSECTLRPFSHLGQIIMHRMGIPANQILNYRWQEENYAKSLLEYLHNFVSSGRLAWLGYLMVKDGSWSEIALCQHRGVDLEQLQDDNTMGGRFWSQIQLRNIAEKPSSTLPQP